MSNSEKVNILIVDDRSDGLLAMEAVLSDPQYNIVTASSGPEALAHLQGQRFAVILLDVQMPQMNGFETAAIIKRRPESRDIPIIFVTAINKDIAYIYQGYEAGAVDYLFKPFDADILRSKVAVFAKLYRKTRIIEQQAEALHQARKLEAVGRLAGGVAHDFNNLITGIIGIAEELKNQMPPGNVHRADVDEIIRASNRAFDLTKQLLASGRRQMMSPRILNINDIISEMNRMLARLIGEDIQLTTDFARDLANVKADPSQIEQIVMNLLINARDAMPKGGTVTVRTENIWFDARHRRFSSQARAGHYIALEVSDSGSGMDEETLAHIFEPFFSTKEMNRGTGLGLATVYGIVKQNNGEIFVDSEPGKGTTFTIFLPQAEEKELIVIEKNGSTADASTGSETILVVEDEEIVRRVVRNLLQKRGYRVIEARHGTEALQVACDHEGPLDMIVTDVVMPGLNGRQVVDALKSRFPTIAVLYMSGFTEEIINHRGILEPGIFFIEKSAVGRGLCKKVREILDGRSAQQPPFDTVHKTAV